MAKPICESCGKEIDYGEEVICVEYGKLWSTAHPHNKVSKPIKNWFHKNCDVAIRKDVN
jgi:hypothetical protein